MLLGFSGIVTRRPLVLQLHKSEQGMEDYAEFLHLEKKRFTDFCMLIVVQIFALYGFFFFWSNDNIDMFLTLWLIVSLVFPDFSFYSVINSLKFWIVFVN